MVNRYGKAHVSQPILAAFVLGCSVAWLPGLRAAPGDATRQAAPAVAMDRWLVTDPIAAESETALAAPADDLPGIETSPERLFPDRDIELAGAYWHLVRRDSSARFDLDSLFPERPPVAVTYAHAYIWSPEPRTARLRWREPVCGGALVWLNALRLRPASPVDPSGGDPAAGGEREMPVRLAGGWNTLLTRVVAGDCAYPLEARLEPADGFAESEAPVDALSGLRVQASRPPGVRRVYPAGSLTIGAARLLAPLVWTAGADELAADLWLETVAWGAPAAGVEAREPGAGGDEAPQANRFPRGRRPPPGRPGAEPPGPPPGAPAADPDRDRLADLRARLLPDPPPPQPAPSRAEVEAKAGGAEARRTVRLEGPGRAVGVRLRFPLRNLERAARSDGVEARLRWTVEGDDRRLAGRLTLSPDALLESAEATIVLDGWTEEDGVWSGEWRVPETLSGSSLEASSDATIGRWTLNDREVGESEPIRLCSPCARGDRLRLRVGPATDGTEPPRVIVSRR